MEMVRVNNLCDRKKLGKVPPSSCMSFEFYEDGVKVGDAAVSVIKDTNSFPGRYLPKDRTKAFLSVDGFEAMPELQGKGHGRAMYQKLYEFSCSLGLGGRIITDPTWGSPGFYRAIGLEEIEDGKMVFIPTKESLAKLYKHSDIPMSTILSYINGGHRGT